MVLAVEKVRQRLLRASRALEQANIAYAVIGGNAVAAWVAKVDEAAVRNTQDVDLLLERSQLEAAIVAMHSAGFVFRHVAGVDRFLDGPEAKAAPSLSEAQNLEGLSVLSLEALVRMKLTSYRDKDRTHLRDLLEVGLVDQTWVGRLPGLLCERLQAILDTPEG